MFAEKLRNAMNAKGINATELARDTGIGNSAISQYLSGKNIPRKDKIIKLAHALKVSEEFLLGYEENDEYTGKSKITVGRAAKLMGVSQQFVRIGLQRGSLPFGFALMTHSDGKRLAYYISPKHFSEYTGISLDILMQKE
jgi:transcriptional regulator with XRE-family HTH domain